MFDSVSSHKVSANVRAIGAIGSFYSREFNLMLGIGAKDTPERRKKEAIRILNQIGYETRGITVEEHV